MEEMKGVWKPIGIGWMGDKVMWVEHWKCSECGSIYNYPPNTCPHCGTYMDMPIIRKGTEWIKK